MKAFDILAGLLLLISGLNGLWRGAASEVARVVSFLIAVVTAVYALRVTGPAFGEVVDPPWVANTAAVLIVFIAVYLLLRLIGAGMTRRVHDHAALGALDRVMGLAFGLLRALAVLGVFQLLYAAAAGSGPGPAWVSGALLYPTAKASGDVLRVFAPRIGEMSEKLPAAITTSVRQGATSAPNEGYSDGERDQLDDLVESAR